MKIGPVILGIGILGLAGYVYSSRDTNPPEPPARPGPPATSATETANQLETYLRENFGMPGYATSWYTSIKTVWIEGTAAVAEITQSVDAPKICGAISGYVYDRTRSHHLSSVRIEGPNRRVFLNRRNIGDPCSLSR